MMTMPATSMIVGTPATRRARASFARPAAIHHRGLTAPVAAARAPTRVRAVATSLSSRATPLARILPGRIGGARRAFALAVRAAAAPQLTPNGTNASAADAVNNGLACFQMRKYDQAVANFTAALENFGTPTEDESRAALYNRACANVKLQKYDDVKADLTAAVNDYDLKFSVVLKDPDMEVFRGTPQYEAMSEDVKGFRATRPSPSSRPRRRSRSDSSSSTPSAASARARSSGS